MILTKVIEKIRRYISAVRGISLVKNKITVIWHILGLYDKDFVIYSLKNGLKLEVPNVKKNRTTILSIEEIFGREIYFTPSSNKKKVIIDLGAQAGIYSLYAALKNRNAKIYALEPDPDNYKQLRKNIEINKLHGTIIPFNKAIAKEDGKLYFYLSNQSSRSSSLLNIMTSGKKIMVYSISLQSLFEMLKLNRCDILKIDVEGAEYEVFYNSPAKIIREINMIYMECHDVSRLKKDYNKSGMKKFLRNNGFKVINEEREIIIAKNLN
jgi:FkbM family methyltransferase